MEPGQHAAVAVLEVEVALFVVEPAGGEEQGIDFVAALLIDGLQGGEGHVGTPLPLIAHVAVDTYHLESEGPHVDELSHGVGVELLKDGLGRVLVEHDHFALLLDVNLVDEASGNQLHGLDLDLRGRHAHQGGADVVCAVAQRYAALVHLCARLDYLLGEEA